MMLPSRHYVSEHTRSSFASCCRKSPSCIDKQREGRAIWWDKRPQELAEERARDASRVPQSPYVYDADS